MTRLVWRWRTCADPSRPPGHRITHPLAARFGEGCDLLAQGRNGNRLVRFDDGLMVVAPLYATRATKDVQSMKPSEQKRLILRMLDGPGEADFDELLARVRPMTESDLLALVYLLEHKGLIHLADGDGTVIITQAGRQSLVVRGQDQGTAR